MIHVPIGGDGVKKYVDRGASEDLSAAGPEIRARA
jgi:hypothetical protein